MIQSFTISLSFTVLTMGAADHANNHLQEITKIFDNLEPKKQVAILKACAGSHLGELKVICKRRGILFFFEDEQITCLQRKIFGQISNRQPEIKFQKSLTENKNNNKNKTNDEVSITAQEDITNNSD